MVKLVITQTDLEKFDDQQAEGKQDQLIHHRCTEYLFAIFEVSSVSVINL